MTAGPAQHRAASPASAPPVVSRTFPPEARSVPAARRFVREVVRGAGLEVWVDDAQLAVSELATNATLHAHTPFEVSVQVDPDGVYVQVWDDDPTQPSRRASDLSSTTGRGMELVAGVSTAHGVQVVGPTKVVWFCLGMARPEHAEDVLLDRWHDRLEDAPEAQARDRARTVVLAGMPVALWLSAREHHNSLMREFALHVQAQSSTTGVVPERLVQADRARSLVLTALRAAAPREPTTDLALLVRPDQAAWFTALRDVLDQAEQLARAGELLAAPGPPSVVAVRQWAAGQVVDQLRGGAPRPWRGAVELPPT